jgi:hypothetical protein
MRFRFLISTFVSQPATAYMDSLDSAGFPCTVPHAASFIDTLSPATIKPNFFCQDIFAWITEYKKLRQRQGQKRCVKS